MSAAPGSLFAGLVDDAALFPPGNAPMDVAVRDHARHHAASYGEIVGPFLCPVSRIDELVAVLPEDQRLELSLVVDLTGEAAHAALRTVAGDPRLRLAAVEASAERLGDDVATVGANLHRLPGVVGFLEVPRKGLGAALDHVGPTGWHAAKYRTGGTSAVAFPTAAELAAFLRACADRSLPFKLTAGLHHAVRNTETSTGFEQHGVLNVLVATHAASTGHDIGAIAEVLDQRDADALVATVTAWSQQDALPVRRLFRSFGCCGVTDPIDELTELGLVGLATTEESRA
jgi:hypothetical protein